MWFDFGAGHGGDLITFGTLYHNCNTKELLQRLSQYTGNPPVSFHPPTISGIVPGPNPLAGEKKETTDSKIALVETRSLTAPRLIRYLEKRCIPVEIASQFCKEVDFLLYGKQHTVIGFQNNSGGYELRNKNFKGSSSPKDITFIDNNQQQVAVFEGFFSYLSFQTLSRNAAGSMVLTQGPAMAEG